MQMQSFQITITLFLFPIQLSYCICQRREIFGHCLARFHSQSFNSDSAPRVPQTILKSFDFRCFFVLELGEASWATPHSFLYMFRNHMQFRIWVSSAISLMTGCIVSLWKCPAFLTDRQLPCLHSFQRRVFISLSRPLSSLALIQGFPASALLPFGSGSFRIGRGHPVHGALASVDSVPVACPQL